MITEEDRKHPIDHGCKYFKFKSSVDLSIGVQVIPYGYSMEYDVESYSQDLASFMCW